MRLVLLLALLSGAASAAIPCPKTTGGWRQLIQDVYRYFSSALGDNTSFTPSRDTLEKMGLVGSCFEGGVPAELKACVDPSRKLLTYLVNTGKIRKAGPDFRDIRYEEMFPKGFKGPSYIASQYDKREGASSTYNPGIWKMGFNGDDKRYLEGTGEFTDAPLELRSPEFLDNTLDLKNLPKAEAYLEKLNQDRADKKLPPILYATYQPVAADNTRERMTLYFPGNPAKWVAVVIGGEDPTFSVVGVEKQEKREPPYAAYFRDHKKVRKGDKVTLFSPNEAVFPGDCRGCHKSGPLMPRAKGDVSPKGTKDYDKMREIMDGYPPMGFGDMAGPPYPLRPLGDPKDQGTMRRILEACVTEQVSNRLGKWSAYYKGDILQKELVADSIGKVQKAVNCSGCHDGAQRAELTPPFGPSFGRYLKEGHMPPHNKLSKEERMLLDDCLDAAYLRSEAGSVVLTQLIENCPEGKGGAEKEKSSSGGGDAKSHEGVSRERIEDD